MKYDVTQDPSDLNRPRCKNESSVLISKGSDIIWDSIAFPVERATACLTSVKAEIAPMSMSEVSKESQGIQRKMHAYLNFV